MHLPTKAAHRIGTSPWVVLLSSIGSIIGLGVFINDIAFQPSTSVGPILLFIILTIFYTAVTIASLIVLGNNRKLKDVAESFREINSIYKDRLFGLFSGDNPIAERDKLVGTEQSTLSAVCQRIGQIYTKLIGKECVVTVKLLTQEDNGALYVTTYARSEDDCERDKSNPKKYEVNTGQNTAFDQALMKDTTGNITHFYSGDLKKHKNYQNQRPNWSKFYQSAIVVPIRCLGVEGKAFRDDIGFLCVDTKSRNRLDNSYHVTMLAALSDQMYNFISLMRGTYSVSVKEAK